MEKKFKITLCILVIALISVIAFAGVYTKGLVSYDSKLPEYVLGSDLTGKRVSYFEVSDSTEEKIFDKDGKEVEKIPEGANEADYRKENVKVNADEALTEENFKKVKEIFEGRFKGMNVEDYNIRINMTTGDAVVELPDNSNTDGYLQYLLFKGNFVVNDTESGTTLLDRSNVETSYIDYEQKKDNTVTVYLNIKYNKDCIEKLKEISQQYLKIDNEEDQKTISVMLEGYEISSMSFDKTIEDGIQKIEIGNAQNNTAVNNYLNQAGFYAFIINNGEMPLEYTISTSEFVTSEIGQNTIYVIIALLSAIVAVLIIYMIMKFKVNGLFAGLSLISAIAILLLLLRYTKTTISLGAFAGIAILIAAEAYFLFNILNRIKKDSSEDNVREVTLKIYLKRLDVIIVFLVIAVVFTFMKEVKIFSIGMTLFYGIISLAVANLVFLRNLLINKSK